MEAKNFELASDMRVLSTNELVGILTEGRNATFSLNSLGEQEVLYGEAYSINAVLNQMPPTRRKYVEAGIELFKRISSTERVQIRNSEHIYKEMYPILADCENEELWVIYLNQSAKIIKKKRISMGGLAATQADIRIILREALLCNATSLILSHNHPSGNIHPSGDDDRLTQNLFQAAKTMNIRMLDHVIVTNGAYYSYADEGRI